MKLPSTVLKFFICSGVFFSGIFFAAPKADQAQPVSKPLQYGLRATITGVCFASLFPFMKEAWKNGETFDFIKAIGLGSIVSYGACVFRNRFVQGVGLCYSGPELMEFFSQKDYTRLSKHALMVLSLCSFDKYVLEKIDPSS